MSPILLPSRVQHELDKANLKSAAAELERAKANFERAEAKFNSKPAPTPEAVPDEEREQAC